MAEAATVRVGVARPWRPTPRRAQLVTAAGRGQLRLVLPWWPTTVEWSGLAVDWQSTDRPGRTPVLDAAGYPLRQVRLDFELGRADRREVSAWVATFDEIARTTRPVAYYEGPCNLGWYRVTDATRRTTEWDVNARPSLVDVSATLTRASGWAVPVGPVAPPGRGGVLPDLGGTLADLWAGSGTLADLPEQRRER